MAILQDSLTCCLRPGKYGSKEEGETIAASPSVSRALEFMPGGERDDDGECGDGDDGG